MATARHRPRQRRWAIPIGLLAFIIVLAVAAEFGARALVTSRISSAITGEFPGASGIEPALPAPTPLVALGLLRGEVTDVAVHAEALPLEGSGLSLTDVDVSIGTIRLHEPGTYLDLRAEGTVPISQISQRVAVALTDLDVLEHVSVTADEADLLAHATVAGFVPLEVAFTPRTRARTLELVPRAIRTGELELDSPRLTRWGLDAGRLAVTIDLDQLPAGLHLEAARVRPDGLHVALTAG